MESLEPDAYDERLFQNQTLYCEGGSKTVF